MVADQETTGVTHVPSRDIPVPAHLSPEAQAVFTRPAFGTAPVYPAVDDKDGWSAHVAQSNEAMRAMMQAMGRDLPVDIAERVVGETRIFIVTPPDVSADSRGVILDIHGGALIMGGGPLCRVMAAGTAARLQARVWSVDYRMPPDHPYPAALDDCVAAYRALLEEREPHEIIVEGMSAGGNLAAALVLRARDEGLPLPGGVILGTPECDLTESGDSFQTNLGVDSVLGSLMPANLLYADGHDLAHPYLSPLFGDFAKGFPPTILTTGTRDLFLSNTVRMHRALRAAGIPAELHVLEAGTHIGFPMAPEQEEIDKEVRRFIRERLAA